MKKGLKTLISITLLFAILASPVSVMASFTQFVAYTNNVNEIVGNTTREAIGSLEVDLELELPISNIRETILDMYLIDENNKQVELNINLKDANRSKDVNLEGQTIKVDIQKTNMDRQPVLDEEEYRFLRVTFDGLKQGIYRIKLVGNGFVDYTSEVIEISEYSKRLHVSNVKGTFALGDVNRDQKIDMTDYELLIDQIEKKENQDLVKYDLNCDGKVDVTDLSYIARNIQGEEVLAKINNTNPIIDINNVTVMETEGTTVEGNIANLFDNTDNVVSLTSEETISEQNPVTLQMEFNNPVETEKVVIEPNKMSDENVPTKLELEVIKENGEILKKFYEYKEPEVRALSNETTNGTIIIDLGNQVAIKKITIKIVETRNNTNLAEIAQVEFLNNVYEELPPPHMDIPQGLKLEVGSETIKAKWLHAANVTGYKVKVTGGKSDLILETTNNTIDIGDLKNYTKYKVSVESVNGTWKSGFCEEVEAEPIPNRLPPVPENIRVSGKYLRIDISWKSMDDTQSYNIYYRKAGETEYTKIEKINTTSYTIDNLENEVEYEIAISGNNHLGEGAKSANNSCITIGIDPPITHNYKLINTSNGENQKTAHIQSVQYPIASATENFDEFDIVDDDYASSWIVNTWDSGGFNENGKAPIVTFDDTYKIDNLVVITADNQPFHYNFYCRIRYWNNNGVNGAEVPNIGWQKKTSSNGKQYHEFNFAEPIEANKIQVSFGNYSTSQNMISIAEMKFYYYDDLEEKVSKLFTDDLRIELAEGVTEETIKALEDRANTPDEVSGEYHPNKDIILNDLNYARQILNDTKISDIISVDQTINNGKNGHLGFSYTLNDMQPLGIVANSGEQIAIYVGTTSNNTNLEVICTQYYPEYSSWKRTVKTLVKGQNIIDIPQITSMDVEKGGAVYIRYKSNTATQVPIKVRVSGGERIPLLDIHGLTDEQEIKAKISTYVEELKAHVEKLESYYSSKGQTYNEGTSILNSTDIVMDDVMLSVPASRALSGITNGLADTNSQVERLYNSSIAFEQMVNLFYKEKGISKTSSNAKDKWPGSRLNIRYTRMFDGAFMYASGEHIGIGLGSVSGLMSGRPIVREEDGTYTGSGFFGWGISHEIGHVIDQNGYASAETTNNIYALLAQTADDKAKSRLELSNKYEKIYKKVTSHTAGLPSDVFVGLGMYWQLHLAYDNEPTITATNTFFSRFNTLYRNDTLGNAVDKNNKLIRYASEAAGKDLTDYFEAWGLKADESTKTYLAEKGYEKETRPIYYINDEARRYRINGGTTIQNAEVTANLELVTENKQTKLSFNISKDADKLLGYEIRRNGESIGFTEGTEYIDELNALNNRVLNYEVVAYDKLLNEVGRVTLEPVKIEHEGTISKNDFTITSNMRNENDDNEYEAEGEVKTTIGNMLDGDVNTAFNGNTRKVTGERNTPYFVIDLNQTLPICGFKYTAAVENGKLLENTIQRYNIYVSEDISQNSNWKLVKQGSFGVTAEKPTGLIYFDAPGSSGGNQLYTANAGYVRIEAVGNSGISGAEIDLISPPGDNITIKDSDVYVLEEDYQFAEGEDNVIRAGNVIIKGEYRGNPAYNAGLLIDGKGETVENYNQIFMAAIPDGTILDEISSGYWVAYMTRESYEAILATEKVKANLYRVNDAETNEGQRLVSDTFYINLKPYESLQKTILVDDTKN
ncbi:MAG: hypothetical protein HFJ54_01960 [Clostridia bacterium]|nr:hypothetical protein [Clostridia bacterium]